MLSIGQQFRDLPNPVGTFEEIFCSSLQSLVADLSDSPWFIREREIVNLFVFRHLVPQFQQAMLDISQIGIEIPVQVEPDGEKGRSRVYADIVVWPHFNATIWRTCKPLARIEWKNISCREGRPSYLRKQHVEDIDHLTRNCDFASLNYAVLTSRSGGSVNLECTKISDRARTEFLPTITCSGTGNEALLRQHLEVVLRRTRDCDGVLY